MMAAVEVAGFVEIFHLLLISITATIRLASRRRRRRRSRKIFT